MSLSQGVFPKTWKTAIVRPLLKKVGLELICSDYRPVSNLPFLSKVLEKAALAQFNRHCDTYELMPDYQSAYRRDYSCETALVKLVNDILWNFERQNITALVAVDLSAAFDTVDHDTLLDVLVHKFGVTEYVLKWFESYLRPRQYKVKIKESYSSNIDLECSVPQGSCAGHVLYLAYASTLREVVPTIVDLHGYADDHAMKKAFLASDRTAES